MQYAVLMKILKSKIFWYIVIGLILFFFIKKRYNIWRLKASNTFIKDRDYQVDETGNVIAVRKEEMENLAQKLYTEIYGWGSWFNSDNDIYEEVYALNDQDLEFMAKYYKNYITRGNTLYEDITSEYVVSSINEQIAARLLALGLAG
jgi:hypothetical protein